MSLLNKIKVIAPAPEPTPTLIQTASAPPAAPAAEDNIIDIEQRDAYIRAVLAVPGDVALQGALVRHLGLNTATLQAAVKLLCRGTDTQLADRFGVAEPEVFRTAAEWADLSRFQKRSNALPQ